MPGAQKTALLPVPPRSNVPTQLPPQDAKAAISCLQWEERAVSPWPSRLEALWGPKGLRHRMKERWQTPVSTVAKQVTLMAAIITRANTKIMGNTHVPGSVLCAFINGQG